MSIITPVPESKLKSLNLQSNITSSTRLDYDRLKILYMNGVPNIYYETMRYWESLINHCYFLSQIPNRLISSTFEIYCQIKQDNFLKLPCKKAKNSDYNAEKSYRWTASTAIQSTISYILRVYACKARRSAPLYDGLKSVHAEN